MDFDGSLEAITKQTEAYGGCIHWLDRLTKIPQKWEWFPLPLRTSAIF
jgi:hypothetical protein